MDIRNIIEILDRNIEKTNDEIIKHEFSVWRNRIEYPYPMIESYFVWEKKHADYFFMKNSIVSDAKIKVGSSMYSYSDFKKAVLVRKYVELLLKNKW